MSMYQRTALIGDTLIGIELELRRVGFLRRGDNRSTLRK